MTDNRIEKIRAEIERLYNQSLADENRQADRGLERAANVSYGKSKVCKELLSFIDTLQEEPVSEKECMYSKGNYTDEDRKVLCDGCEEECEFNKKEEYASEDLDIAIGEYCSNPDNFITYIDVAFAYRSEQKDDIPLIIKAIKFGANWQKVKDQETIETAIHHAYHNGKLEMKEEMLANAVDAVVKIDAGGYPYVDRTIELYDYDKDIPLAKKSDKVKILVIREE